MTDPITRMQDDIEALLNTCAALATVTIRREDKGTTTEIVNKALQGIGIAAGKKPGLVIVITQPDFKVTEKESPVIEFELQQTITVLERPLFNRVATGTQITAPAAVEIVTSRLHYRGVGIGYLLLGRAEPLADEALTIGYNIIGTVQRSLGAENRATEPRITFAAGNCTLAGSGASGELIYYTIDGSAPVPAPTGAALTYSAPFAVTSGMTVRAATICTGKEIGDFSEEVAP